MIDTKGLTTTEAKLLFQQFGGNKIAEPKGFSFFGELFAEIFSFLNLLLMVAAVISFGIGNLLDGFLILAIVILNGVISFWQEYKAEQTLNELKELSHSFARVLRDGKEVLLDSLQLVPGDIVKLEAGDKVPADGLVLEAFNMEVNESALTGESVSVYKKADEPEHNQLFAATLVSAGTGIMKISSTGEQTRFGRIAKTLGEIKETETPLQKQIKSLALNIGLIAVFFSGLIFLTGVALKHNLLETFLLAVSIAIAAIPEGLPAIILITLAAGVKRMARRKAIVRKMVAIEGLGSINVICTDKTGTLTMGEMSVTRLWFNGRFYSPSEFKSTLKQRFGKKFLDSMIIPNTANLTYKFDHGSRTVLGDSTEGALLMFAESLGIDHRVLRNQGKTLDEFSFDQRLKTMSVVKQMDKETEAFIKASPEITVEKATRIAEHDHVRLVNEQDKQKLTDAYTAMTKVGLRVLGFAMQNRLNATSRYKREEIENDFIFLGFVGLSDPPRPEAKESIRLARVAGIDTVMITGDNELTAMKIANELDLAAEGDQVMLGRHLNKLSDRQLQDVIQDVKVFARTNPEDKLRIIQAFQKIGKSVAVTGDGVNDSLALKQAEIGVAMGRHGTDVAKEAADIIITDDNYATIVSAIDEGRTIFSNVLKSIRYLVSTNIAELLVIFIALLLGMPSPLLPAQILWVNLVSDGLPAIALALDPKDPNSLKRKPRDKNHKLLDLNALSQLLFIGIVAAVLTLFVYTYTLKTTGNLILARTWAFTILIFLQMIVAFIIRGNQKTANYKLIWAVVITLAVQLVIITVPFFHALFKIQNPF